MALARITPGLSGNVIHPILKPPASRAVDIFLNRAASASLPGQKAALLRQMRRDIRKHLSKDEQRRLREEILCTISTHQFEIPPRKLHWHILQAMSTYATSYVHYGPVLFEWVESVLNTALVEDRKLIFIARDGYAPYRTAQILREKFPEKFGAIDLSLLYLSRTLVYSSTHLVEKIGKSDKIVKEYVETLNEPDPFLLRKYIQQETGMTPGQKCLFVDVGFAGSIIPSIQKQLSTLEIDARFCFLISHTRKSKILEKSHRAKGFLAHAEKRPLDPVNKAGKNPAIHWLEDTHQYIYQSPKILIAKETGQIVPACLTKQKDQFIIHELFGHPPQTCADNPEEFLIKWYGFKGAIDAIEKGSLSPLPPVAWKKATEERRQSFSAFLTQLRLHKRFLLMRHIS